MLQEAVVILACVTSKGCSQTSGHYFNLNPDTKKIIKRQEKKIKEYIGPDLPTVVGPGLFLAVGGTGTIRLNRYFSIQTGPKKTILTYRIEF